MEVVQDIPRIYTGLAEWLSCMVFILMSGRRLKGYAFAAASAAMLLMQCFFLVITDDVPEGIFWMLCMAAAMALMYAYLVVVGGYSFLTAGYCAACAFLAAEFAASLGWQLCDIAGPQVIMSRAGVFFLMMAVYAAVFTVTFILFRHHLTDIYLRRLSYREVGAALLIVVIAFFFSNISFVLNRPPFGSYLLEYIFMIRTLVDLGGLAVLYAFQSRIAEYIAQQEVAVIRQVLKSQYEQYRNFQQSEEQLHMMQHDLKHQIDGLRAETDMQKRTEWLNRMEKELESWWVPQKSGSPVLDTLLAGKLLRARNLGIRITCVADGSLLSMMHVTDVCTIFGNALDNAIESVVLIPEEEKRLIHVSVASEKQFVFIQVANTCETELRRGEDSALLTTKPDPINHGYGMKGIKYAAEKYGGTVSYSLENVWFELRILIPMESLPGQEEGRQEAGAAAK